jgi:hypothetical protein
MEYSEYKELRRTYLPDGKDEINRNVTCAKSPLDIYNTLKQTVFNMGFRQIERIEVLGAMDIIGSFEKTIGSLEKTGIIFSVGEYAKIGEIIEETLEKFLSQKNAQNKMKIFDDAHSTLARLAKHPEKVKEIYNPFFRSEDFKKIRKGYADRPGPGNTLDFLNLMYRIFGDACHNFDDKKAFLEKAYLDLKNGVETKTIYERINSWSSENRFKANKKYLIEYHQQF